MLDLAPDLAPANVGKLIGALPSREGGCCYDPPALKTVRNETPDKNKV
jgi:hypothetical protein